MFGSRRGKQPSVPASAALAEGPPGDTIGSLVTNGFSAEQSLDSSLASSNDRQTPPASGALNAEEAQRRTAIAVRQSLAFAQIISVLMRSPIYKHYTLADLEWLVLPPLLTGQFSLAEVKAQTEGPTVAVAIALWASVSEEVDRRLCENLSAPIRLRPDEWRSGDILWLVDAVGDERVVRHFLTRLAETTFKGHSVKYRRIGLTGKAEIEHLNTGVVPDGVKHSLRT